MTGPNPAPNPALEKARKKLRDQGTEFLVHNAIGRVCTDVFENEKSQNRCMAGQHLYDSAKHAMAAGGLIVAAGVTAPTVAGGLLLGAGAIYNIFRAEDSLLAGIRQLITGEKTDTMTDRAMKGMGAWIKKKWYGEEAEEPAAEAPAAAPPAADAPMRGGFGPADPSSISDTAIV